MEASVRAQANIRLKLGFPVLVLTLLGSWYLGSWPSHIGLPEICSLAVVYTAYNIAAYHFSMRLRPFTAWEVTLATAILDPIMLSGGLSLVGDVSIVVVCFYLFTILGFGFRSGIVAMRVCQCVSLLGFLFVISITPVWQQQPLVAMSNMLFLVAIPLYASVLIRKLHAARALVELESSAKSQLLANVSHELRTPLSGIVSSAQLIEAESSDPVIAERATSILKLSGSLGTEIDQLLDIARHQAKPVIELAAFDVRQILEHLRLALAPNAAIRNIELDIRIDDGVVSPVIGSARDLSSVLMNLAGNAVKFTEQGRVDVAVELIGEEESAYRLRFTVRDTGIGIPAELKARIFEPFFQVSGGAARRYGGTGLGTTIAKESVALMGGELQVESELGVGSVFTFELRMVKGAQPDVRTPEASPIAPIVDSKHILVVDDNEANLVLVKEMLMKDGHQVVTASCGEEALEYLNMLEFDVIFLDFHMAGMDGAQVFELYRFGKVATAPTYFITADTTPATVRRLRDLGASGLLYRPVTFKKLRDALAGEFGEDAAPSAGADMPAPSASATRQAQPAPPAPMLPSSGTMPFKVVPVAYIDEQVLASLRDVSSKPEFLVRMLSTGIADIERLSRELIRALENNDVESVRHYSHALKGVCLNLGALRLASLASRLMTVTAADLQRGRLRWQGDIELASRLSIDGLRGALDAAA